MRIKLRKKISLNTNNGFTDCDSTVRCPQRPAISATSATLVTCCMSKVASTSSEFVNHKACSSLGKVTAEEQLFG